VIANGSASNFVVFDSDADEQDPGKRAKHEKDNKALLALLGKANENPLPNNQRVGPGFVMWRSNIGSLVRTEIGAAEWSAFKQKLTSSMAMLGDFGKIHCISGSVLPELGNQAKDRRVSNACVMRFLNPAVSVQ